MIKRALVEYLVNAVWQLPLLAGGAWLLVRACDLAPRTQHRLWVAVLALAVLMPLRTTPHKQQTEIAGLAERPAEGVRAQTFRSVAAHVAKKRTGFMVWPGSAYLSRARHQDPNNHGSLARWPVPLLCHFRLASFRHRLACGSTPGAACEPSGQYRLRRTRLP